MCRTFGDDVASILKKEDCFSRSTSTGSLQIHLVKQHKIRVDEPADHQDHQDRKKQRPLVDVLKMTPAQERNKHDEDLLDMILDGTVTLTIVRRKPFRKFCRGFTAAYAPASVETLYKLLLDRKILLQQGLLYLLRLISR